MKPALDASGALAAHCGGEPMQPTSTQSLVPAGSEPAGETRARDVELESELPQLRNFAAGELVDAALEALRARFATCVVLSSLLWLPVQALQSAAVRMHGVEQQIATIAMSFATLIVHGLTTALVTMVVYGFFQRRRVRTLAALLVGLKRAPALLVSNLVVSLGSGIGMACCLLPGIYLLFRWSCASPALVLERLGPLASLTRSAQLAKNGFVPWLGMILLAWLLIVPLNMLSALMRTEDARAWLEPHLGIAGGSFAVVETLAGAVFSGVGTAFLGVVATIYYLHLRSRAEGIDLELKLERLALANALEPAPAGPRA
jgi:hypothetical protein